SAMSGMRASESVLRRILRPATPWRGRLGSASGHCHPLEGLATTHWRRLRTDTRAPAATHPWGAVARLDGMSLNVGMVGLCPGCPLPHWRGRDPSIGAGRLFI